MTVTGRLYTRSEAYDLARRITEAADQLDVTLARIDYRPQHTEAVNAAR